MNAGDLDLVLAFQRAVTSENDLGEETAAGWTPIATVLAHRAPVSDGERNTGAQVARVVTDRFTTHWSETLMGVTGADQAVCEGVAYDVVGKKPIGRRQWIEWSLAAQPDVVRPDAP